MVYEIKFIPYEELIFFEEYKEEQLIKIKSNIDAQKALSNLPIVMRTESNKYLVLDGTHRILALNKLRCMNITAQIIDESIVVCSSWLHQIPKCEELISDLKNNPSFYFTGENLLEQKYLARVYIDNQVYYLYDMDSKKREEGEAISFLHSIINVYDSKYGYTKTTK
ncbi:ParB N-terminal domain-containing protein, partial [Bacillus cereus]